MKLRYAISPKSQTIYIHGPDPHMLYVEYEGAWPYIWVECDTQANHYPRAFDIHDPGTGPYQGKGRLIPSLNQGAWDIYDCGPSTAEDFDRDRWPTKAPIPLRGDLDENL